MSDIFTTQNLIAFVTLTSLEIVLGIDNLIFIAILAGRLPEQQRKLARQLGLSVAVISRIALLFSLTWVMRLKDTLFTAIGHPFTGKDIVLVLGGMFMIAKATLEIHHKVEHATHAEASSAKKASLGWMLLQVLIIDVVFSLDSVITAVGMAQHLFVMIAAVLASVGVMLAASGPVVRFVDAHPAIKLLALSFLLLIGVLLVAEGFGRHIDKGYIYFAMAFSLGVELLNLRAEHNLRKLTAADD
jgi:predicted tellurium resistance membrane protein TerC